MTIFANGLSPDGNNLNQILGANNTNDKITANIGNHIVSDLRSFVANR